jgi:ribonuclease HI
LLETRPSRPTFGPRYALIACPATTITEVATQFAATSCFNQNWHERWLRDGSWKGSSGPVENRDLWERLFGLVWDERRDVAVKWIKGHAGDPNNNRVDRLARAAALSAG